MSNSENELEILESEFKKAADQVKQLKSVSQSNQLELYSYYKQATIGDVNTSQPSIWSLTARAKWDAWNSRQGLSKMDSMKAYLALVNKLLKE